MARLEDLARGAQVNGVRHLSTQKNATVRLTLEIEAELPEGAPDNVVRIVTENARTLKFRSQGFEEE